MLTTVAQVIDVKNHWLSWWEINGKVGLLDSVQCSIDKEKGLGVVTVDMFSL